MVANLAWAQVENVSSSNETKAVLVFRVHDYHFGVPVASIERVIHSAEISPVPDTPRSVVGAVNIHGHVVPVVDLHLRQVRDTAAFILDTKLVIVTTATRRLAILADDVMDIIDLPTEAFAAREPIASGVDLLPNVAAIPGGLIILQDIDRLLTPEDEARLAAALQRMSQ
jgi:purine-binding chemotaxis protein CheW